MSESHGYRNTRTYTTWLQMRQRCNNPKQKDYKNYGGRGISVCDEWDKSFLAFLRDMGERPENTTLDRIKNDQGYFKENCRWADGKTQLRNTRANRIITYNGKTQCLQAWAEEYNINDGTLAQRLGKGWSMEKSLTTPINLPQIGKAHCKKMITHNGETRNIKEWAAHIGISYATLHKRINNYGMSFEKAITKPVDYKRSSYYKDAGIKKSEQ